jgi:nucleotide-binding universal stress UspA family protein
VIDIRRILCPIDYSEFSRRALDHAVAIARWYGSTVTILHVSSVLPIAAYTPVGPVVPPALLTPSDRTAMLAAMRRFAETETAASGVPLEFDLAEGNAAAEIVAAAATKRSDLLVLGTHGHAGFDRLVLGSVAEKVLRKAACPVLTVPRGAPDAAPVPSALFRHILCPVDFSACSLRAFDYAMSLATEADARLTVLSVLELPPGTSDDLEEAVELPRDLRKYVDELERNRREQLKALIPLEAQTYCSVETILATGKPYRQILRLAEEHAAGLIVMGVHSRSAADLLLFGSTTQHVVRRAACPVLTLRAA